MYVGAIFIRYIQYVLQIDILVHRGKKSIGKTIVMKIQKELLIYLI
jgi:hypothetical protein